MKKRLIIAAVLSSMMVLTACSGKSDDGTITITNVSYDPTREFYEKYNKIFESYYEEKYGTKVDVIQTEDQEVRHVQLWRAVMLMWSRLH